MRGSSGAHYVGISRPPPPAEPIKIVILPLGWGIASIAATRPLIAAEPTLRAPRPEIVPELNGAGVGSAAITAPAKQAARTKEYLRERMGFIWKRSWEI